MNTILPLPTQELPVLQAPGAGLPPVESWILTKTVAPLVTRFLSRTQARRIFIREAERLIYLIEDVNE